MIYILSLNAYNLQYNTIANDIISNAKVLQKKLTVLVFMFSDLSWLVQSLKDCWMYVEVEQFPFKAILKC